jgi:hypothetical protein
MAAYDNLPPFVSPGDANRGTLHSAALALTSDYALANIQAGELRCIHLAVHYDLPIDEVCARATDRVQDEIDRRAGVTR